MTREWMPLLGTCMAVRMDCLDEKQAQNNHGQTLERLAQRGGLSPREALAVINHQRITRISENEALRTMMMQEVPT